MNIKKENDSIFSVYHSGLGRKGLNSSATRRPKPFYVKGEVWQSGMNLTEFVRKNLMSWNKKRNG